MSPDQPHPPPGHPAALASVDAADLTWREAEGLGAVPVSARFDDPYYSLEDGLAETCHVFLLGNDLPTRLVPGFRVAELGFGTGLNLLAAWDLAERHGTALRYTGFEAFPMRPEEAARALMPWTPQFGDKITRLLDGWREDAITLDTPLLQAEVILGDARQTLPEWQGMADAWFLDGFAPAKNPELWEPGLLHQVARHTVPGGSFATYTAAGAVRRALAEAGFAVERVRGHGTKRHMTIGRLPVNEPGGTGGSAAGRVSPPDTSAQA